MVASRTWAARGHEPLSPTRQRIILPKASQGIHESGEPRPTKTHQAAAFEPADHRLIDSTQEFELSLRDSDSKASAADGAADELKAPGGARVGIRRLERWPTHASNNGGRRSPGDFLPRQNHVPLAMQLECITWRSSGINAGLWSGDEPGLMHPSCITRKHLDPARHGRAVTA
jgi:hypothetical protein